MKIKTLILLLMVLFVFTSTGCSGDGLFAPTATSTSTATPEPTGTPNPTETPTPTATNTPAPTDTPWPTPTDFPVSLLPGYFAFMSYYECPEMSLTCIGSSRIDGTDFNIHSTFTYGMAVNPGWSPDGRYIVFEFYALGGTGIYELRAIDFIAGTEITISPDLSAGTVTGRSWSPDSAKLAVSFRDGQTDETDLQIIDVQRKRMVNLTNSPGVLDESPAWSPKGDQIVYSSDSDGQLDIWAISPQGTAAINLTGGEDDVWEDMLPSWSPDGSRIAFFRFGDESNGLWIMNADGSNPHLLFDLEKNKEAETPVWSYDGQWIAIIVGSASRKNLWLVDPYYGDSFQVNEKAGDFSQVSWSPDSIALIYNQDLENGNSQLNLEVIGVDWPFHLDMETSIESFVWSPVGTLP
jgi:Tol biopolymer transport system component